MAYGKSTKAYVAIGLAVALVIGLAAFLMTSTERNETMEDGDKTAASSNSSALQLIQTIPLPYVSGRIDHMDADIAGQRLFVAELENNSLEVLDLKDGRKIYSMGGLQEPQGVVFVPDAGRFLVANGGDGTVDIFDSRNYSLVKTIQLSGDADNARYDPSQKLVYVGYGGGGLAAIDPVKGAVVDTIRLDGHPESFQIDAAEGKIFANVPESNSIEVIDSRNGAVAAKWANSGASGNYPMALDAGTHRLFVVYREPSELHVIDSQSGNVLARLAVSGDPDDIFYDSEKGRLYVSGGQGFVDIISDKGGRYSETARVPTENGARTSLFVPQLDRLYVAVPDYSGDGAKIQVFDTQGTK